MNIYVKSFSDKYKWNFFACVFYLLKFIIKKEFWSSIKVGMKNCRSCAIQMKACMKIRAESKEPPLPSLIRGWCNQTREMLRTSNLTLYSIQETHL